jgi:hypothetical protein
MRAEKRQTTKQSNMKKILITALALFCATAGVLYAQDADASKKAKKELTVEQKKVQTDMLAKYDTDKNGKLDKTEKGAMSSEDKAAWEKAFPPKSGKKGKKADDSK